MKIQVLGIGPYQKQQTHKNPMDVLADNMIEATAPGIQSQYIKNLSLLVRGLL